jgi:ribulose-5-phosphate 4-epimerase/fuculose-1-phosphate aldolase
MQSVALSATVVGTGTVYHSPHGVNPSTSQDLVDAPFILPFGQLEQNYFMLVKSEYGVSFLGKKKFSSGRATHYYCYLSLLKRKP